MPAGGSSSRDAEYPFNAGNPPTGYVQRAGGNEYGSLLITHVNGQGVPQRYWVRPKRPIPTNPV